MAIDVIMPQMGESVVEGTIVRWLKKVGDTIEHDEPIFEITTDKVDAEIPAPEAGVLLEIKVPEGETVEVGASVATIGLAGEAPVTTTIPTPSEAPVVSVTTPAPAGPTARADQSAADLRRTRSTPVVRKIAKEHSVELAQVKGSGLDGRVTKKDILAFIEAGPAAVASAPMVAPAAARIDLGVPMASVVARVGDRTEPMSRMRRTISDRMIESKAYSAHVHTCFEVDYTHIDGLRRAHKAAYAARGAKLTFTTFLAKAVVDALGAFPVLNASHDGANVTYRGDLNLGVAVALDEGLIVPVVKGADELSLLGLSKKIVDLSTRARTKKLMPDEVSGLTFTVTNPGIFGGQWGTPIIPQPSVAILGVGTIEKRVKVVTLPSGGDTMAIRLCGYLTLGFDHRVIDGAVADQFMAHLKASLEAFDEALI